MKNNALFLFLLMLPGLAPAQNLVPNPSFEELLECPNLGNWGNIDDCLVHWTDPTNTTSDCFHTCSSNSGLSVPTQTSGDIITGHQYPRTGEGYAGFGARSFNPWNPDRYREYLHNHLTESLEEDHCYNVEFYVSQADIARYAMNVGLLFTTEEIDLNSGWWGAVGPGIMDSPQIEQPQAVLLTDTVNWMRINGTYLAEGGEEYITIGNFDYNYEIDTITILLDTWFEWAYYYVEDVSVTLVSDNLGPARAGPDQELVSGDTTQIGDNPLSDAVYRWYPAEGLNDTMLENPLAFPEVTTTYYCIKRACDWESIDSVTVTVVPTGLYNPVLGSTVTLSPNPNNGEFTISSDQPLSEQLIMEIFDIRGQKVYIDQIPARQETWKVLNQGWSSGLYFLQLKSEVGELLYTTKVVVSR